MDIFDRPPAVAEDTLQYALYPSPEASDKASVSSLAALILAHIQQLLPNHIWHRDPFELKVIQDEGSKKDDKEWHLLGRIRVGDCVDDEWAVVWLLWEVSSRWDIAISVSDSDGEFLLIEAADYLPSWVTPKNAENRVWIFKSKLHLIPLSFSSPESARPKSKKQISGLASDEEETFDDSDENYISVRDALKVLRSDCDSEVSAAIHDTIWKRLSGYPEASLNHLHIAKAHLPIDVAKALSRDPSLVQKAVETFYTRDAIQLRAAHRMSRFPPQPSTLTTFRLTRTAYAQLVGQKFHPPKVFGQFSEFEGTREWKWRDIGMKIACGFEMLYQESKARTSSTTGTTIEGADDARVDALRRDPEYKSYILRLVSAGYFKGELEGSKLWGELERKAAKAFINTRKIEDAVRPSFADLVNTAIARADSVPNLVKLVEEPDDWLDVDAESFDAKMADAMRLGDVEDESTANADAMDVDKPKMSGVDLEDAVAQAQAKKLHGLAKKIEKFVEGEGRLEGAVFEDDDLSSDEPMSDFGDDTSPSNSDNEHAEHESDNAARQEAMARLVAPIDPSEYGRMPPSFYSNSQRIAPITMESERVPADAAANANTTVAEAERRTRPIRKPILPRDKFDGVDSDDETDDEGSAQDEDSEEDKPQVVGDVEIDMSEEQEEFLNFSREQLGISDEQWRDIVRDRHGRGAYVPSGALKKASQSKLTEKQPASARAQSGSGTKVAQTRQGEQAQRKPNSNLDSFEAVMQAMEEELVKAQATKRGTKEASTAAKLAQEPGMGGRDSANKKGKEKEHVGTTNEEDGEDLEAAMDAELREALEREDGDSGDEEPMDYNLMKNFLESFKSQAGLSGPAGSLAGRLEPSWQLPRDET